MIFVHFNIRYLRGEKGLSQQKLANELKLTRNQISSYENQNSDPPIEVLQKLSQYFGVSIDALVSNPLYKRNCPVNENCFVTLIGHAKENTDVLSQGAESDSKRT